MHFVAELYVSLIDFDAKVPEIPPVKFDAVVKDNIDLADPASDKKVEDEDNGSG